MGKCGCGPNKECRKTFKCFLQNIKYWALNSNTNTYQGGTPSSSVLTNATITSFPVQNVVVSPGSSAITNLGALPNGNVIGGYFVTNLGAKVPFGVVGVSPTVSSLNVAGLNYYYSVDGLKAAIATGMGTSPIALPGPIEIVDGSILYTFTEVAFVTTT